jgi:hypothetical protein
MVATPATRALAIKGDARMARAAPCGHRRKIEKSPANMARITHAILTGISHLFKYLVMLLMYEQESQVNAFQSMLDVFIIKKQLIGVKHSGNARGKRQESAERLRTYGCYRAPLRISPKS